MFFKERVKSIKPGDRVLEIGPGATPHEKAEVFLEKTYESEEELIAQSGHVGKLNTDKRVVEYSGDIFPFEDGEFDYVICANVLEHVEDVPKFLNEIMRVGKNGYLEFPTIYYDYMLNIEEHLNILKYDNSVIYWAKKEISPIPELTAFTDFYREVQGKGFRFQNEVNQYLHYGFEWFGKINYKQVDKWQDLVHSKEEIKEWIIHVNQTPYKHEYQGVGFTLKHLMKEIKFRLTGKK